MKRKIAVYDITETITEINLSDNPEKIFNIATIFNTIVGDESIRSHSTISAEFKDESSILKAYNEDRENFDIGSFAEKLLLAECSESSGKRKSTVREGYLFILEKEKELILLKLEKTLVANKETFEFEGQLGTDKSYYKVCILSTELNNIAVIDKSRKVANYWLDSFLGLQEVRNKKINTYDLLELIESKELFSEEIARLENIDDIMRESKKYIFNSNIFDKSGLVDSLNDSGLIDISTHVENFELQFYSDKSSKLDYSFEIDERVLKDHFKSEIRISKETVIKTDNFEKLILDGGVSLVNDEIRLVVDRECLEEIRQKLGE
ncbi:hypothetical protein [Streptococcus mitis]|jgi:sepS10A protein|uniref:37-kD nucleoid-associated bacterial protein n=1 Tax=Streptococcus mitis TaxID=28037 RepID=A0AAX0NAY2_STRMT|nr:hypothetical protein [Streptococcus mitis]MCY7170546.1 hypothetical protein [Streptococcus mitis]MQQ67918.1 hypothetical protein [Streptococcus mitis]ORO90860.1 hypothetical protein B7701_02145 [Streptococcus mitis]